MKKLPAFILLFALSQNLLAQQADTTIVQHKISYKPFIAPALLAGYGLLNSGPHGFPSDLSVRSWRNKHYPTFHQKADDYLVFLPAVSVYALDMIKLPAQHDAVNQTIIMGKTSALTFMLVYALKYSTRVQRPDGTAYNSFPSSHTAFAFAYATVLKNEFRKESLWPAVFGYTVASGVGCMRVLNNRHWGSDVLVGAASGILCSELVYATHKGRWKKKR